MNKFDKYRTVEPQSPKISKFDKYRIKPLEQAEDNDLATLVPKSIVSGVLSPGDIPKILEAPYNIRYGEKNPSSEKAKETLEKFDPYTYNFKQKSLFDLLKEKVKPHPTTPTQRIATNVGEFAGASLLGPMNLLRNFGLGAVIGGTSGIAQEVGVNPIVADIGATLAVPAAPIAGSIAKEGAKRGILKLAGASPEKLNVEALEAAKNLRIELPTAVATNSTVLDLADQTIGKIPYFGDRLKKKYINADEQIKGALEETYARVGPQDIPETTAKIGKLYDQAEAALPHDATILPTNTLENVDFIKNNIVTPIPNLGEVKLLNTTHKLNEYYRPHNINRVPASVKSLIGSKKSLNTDIDWDKHQGIKELLKKVRHGITEDITAYGKQNEVWHKPYTEADQLFGKKERRKKLESMLSDKAINPATDVLSYNSLAKMIGSKENSKRIEKLVEPEIYQKIKDLGTVAKAMAKKTSRIPNPSGTAPTAAALSMIAGLYTAPLTTISTLIGAAGATKLLTSQKFLDLALDVAKGKPSLPKVMEFNRYVKEVTGKTPVILSRELSRKEKKKDSKK